MVEVLLEQPENMVSIEETIKKMEDRAKKKKKPQPTTSFAGSPLSNPPRWAQKRKEIKPNVELQREKRAR